MSKTALAKLSRRAIAIPEPAAPCPLEQRLFDKIVRAIRKQGYIRASGETESCMYKNEAGLRCFVGHALGNRYHPSIEGQPVETLIEDGYLAIGEGEADLLEELQAIHDDTDPENWEDELADLAMRRSLQYTKPKK